MYSYSKVNCETRAAIFLAAEECGCVPWYISEAGDHDREVCGLQGNYCYDSKIRRGKVFGSECPMACSNIRYCTVHR